MVLLRRKQPCQKKEPQTLTFKGPRGIAYSESLQLTRLTHTLVAPDQLWGHFSENISGPQFPDTGCVFVSVAQSGPTLCIPTDCIARQASLSMEFSRQEYWSGLPFLLQRNFPTQGLNPGLLHLRQILYCLSYREVYKSWIYVED